jgi:hypothetical protein
MQAKNYNRRRVPVVRPSAPEPIIAAEATATARPGRMQGRV